MDKYTLIYIYIQIDAAARVLDPVFRGVRDEVRDYGRFFKDYRYSEW